ncbi:MAG: hypothetical protein ACREM3_23260 [Candidatus Rokuibacteriota bacterium]
MRTLCASLLAAAMPIVALLPAPSAAQSARTPLRNVAAEQIVSEVAYCRGEYRLMMADGQQKTFREFDLRLKTDTSAYGPERGKPVLLPAGMRGDRVQLVFSGPEDLKRSLVERCNGGAS